MKNRLLIAAIGLLFVQGPAFAELDPLQKYDNFNAKKYKGCKFCINSEKWYGAERGNRNTEVEREIRSKRVNLTHTSWGRSDSDEGTEQGRNRMIFRDRENFSGVCFTPRVRKYRIPSCNANEGSGQARIRYLGNFYDTNAADDGEEDGVVYAGFQLGRGGWSENKKGIFEVSGWAQECEGADCDADAWSTYDEDNDPDLWFGTTKGSNQKKEMCLGYDRDTHELVFSYGKEERRVNNADHGLPAFGANVDADWAWHVIETRTDVPNCSEGSLYGSIEADFDNVGVREFPEL